MQDVTQIAEDYQRDVVKNEYLKTRATALIEGQIRVAIERCLDRNEQNALTKPLDRVFEKVVQKYFLGKDFKERVSERLSDSLRIGYAEDFSAFDETLDFHSNAVGREFLRRLKTIKIKELS